MHAAVEAFHIPDSNVVYVVRDEAASMMKAGRKMKEEFRLETTACSAHLLQTCIGHACHRLEWADIELIGQGAEIGRAL